jgi:hypothetical protein
MRKFHDLALNIQLFLDHVQELLVYFQKNKDYLIFSLLCLFNDCAQQLEIGWNISYQYDLLLSLSLLKEFFKDRKSEVLVMGIYNAILKEGFLLGSAKEHTEGA